MNHARRRLWAGLLASAATLAAGVKAPAQTKALTAYADDVSELLTRRATLETTLEAVRKGHPEAPVHARGLVDKVRPAMGALRAVSDRLEAHTDSALWPFPTYHQMLFQ